jgi:hypothetical protein
MRKVPLVHFLTIYGPLLSLKAKRLRLSEKRFLSINLGQASKRKWVMAPLINRIDYCGFFQQVIQNCSERPNGYFGKSF